jgi:hypothetical protein
MGQLPEPAMECEAGPEPKTGAAVVEVGRVEGEIVDEQGEPASAGLVQICGKDICINADVGDNGLLEAVINTDMDTPACKYGDGSTFGKLALPMAADDTDLGTLTTVRLPSVERSARLTPGEVVSSTGVTLDLAPDARVEVDTLTYEEEESHVFRAASVPAAMLARLDPEFVLAFALAPVETRICPSPALTIENSVGLSPGALLELYILGLDVLEEWAPYAGWQKVGEGQVSEDGARLEFPEGVPVLTAIAVRER